VPLEKRTARFVASSRWCRCRRSGARTRRLCYADEWEARLFDGACAGRIQFSASGHGGFGYDPLVVLDGFTQSFAELGEDVKNQLSHRAKALEKLKRIF